MYSLVFMFLFITLLSTREVQAMVWSLKIIILIPLFGNNNYMVGFPPRVYVLVEGVLLDLPRRGYLAVSGRLSGSSPIIPGGFSIISLLAIHCLQLVTNSRLSYSPLWKCTGNMTERAVRSDPSSQVILFY